MPIHTMYTDWVKKLIFFHVTCTLQGNADAAVGSLLSSCQCMFYTLLGGV